MRPWPDVSKQTSKTFGLIFSPFEVDDFVCSYFSFNEYNVGLLEHIGLPLLRKHGAVDTQPVNTSPGVYMSVCRQLFAGAVTLAHTIIALRQQRNPENKNSRNCTCLATSGHKHSQPCVAGFGGK